MSRSILNEEQFYQKVYGGWMGKNIGGTLGGPVEGKMEVLGLDFYPELKNLPLANDDLDLQLVALHALERHGARMTAKELGQEWLEHVFFPYDEYGYALTNLRRGLIPPVAGSFNNPFVDCMGSPIRSELWAMVAPCAPNIAAHYAYQDAILDHAGGEGVYGEMFFAAIESAAFAESDRDTLIQIGLSYIPADCRTALAVKDLVDWHREGKDWLEARALVLELHGSDNFTDAPQNIAFTILGWLYGENFGDAILKAVNCGYDTDCTAATLGAILGIIGGADSLPANWIEPIGDKVVVSAPIKGFPVPADLDELTRRTIRAAKEVLAVWDSLVDIRKDLATSIEPSLLKPTASTLKVQSQDFKKNRYIMPQGTMAEHGIEVEIQYQDQLPVIAPHDTHQLRFQLTNRTGEAWTGRLSLSVPVGWSKTEQSAFTLPAGESLLWETQVTSDAELRPSYELALVIERDHDGHIWHTDKVIFSLVATASWKLYSPLSNEGVEVNVPGNLVDFEKVLNTAAKGVYRAETLLYSPDDREILLLASTKSPVRATLNGQLVIDAQEATEFMPAYHRAPKSKGAVVQLKKGDNPLIIEIEKTDDQLQLYVLPVAAEETSSPGSHYYHTDILFKSTNL